MPNQNPNTATDYSVNAPSVPPAGTSLLATVPAGNLGTGGAARTGGYFIQNQSANLAYAVFDNGVGANLSVLGLPAGTGIDTLGGVLQSGEDPFTGRIRIYGTAGSQICTRVW